jgi:hypothetical protein
MNVIRDPLGNEIFIHQTAMDANENIAQLEDVLDDISKVIEKPMMLFEMKEGPAELFYLRAIGWNKTMLIGVQKLDNRYEVINYEIDPSIERITKLHAKGERLI